MFMRFLQLKLNEVYVDEFIKFYEADVLAELRRTIGCLFAGLIKSKPEENEFISLTFWQTQKQAEDYETSGAFKKLFEKAKAFLADSVEWKIQLSENMELEIAANEEEPVIKKFVVKAQNEVKDEFKMDSSNMFVRILSLIIRVDKVEEFKRLYSDVIIPALRNTKGCKYIFLTESVNDKDEYISVTVWDSKEDADEYETGGKFDELTEKVKHTFSEIFLWKMSLEKKYGSRLKTSDDFKVEHYDMVTGKSFSFK